MNTTAIKSAAGSFVLGAAVTMIAGFSWGGWMTAGSAEMMAADRAESAVTATLVPFCVAEAARDPAYDAKLALIKEASSWEQDDAVIAAGWVTFPGADEANRDVADQCVDALETLGEKTTASAQ